MAGADQTHTHTHTHTVQPAPSVLHATLALPAQPQHFLVPQRPGESEASICNFRTCPAAHRGFPENVFGEERFYCKTVPSINPDLQRSQAETRNSHVNKFDSSAPKTGSAGAAKSVSSFSKKKNVSQMFSSTEN